MQVYVPDCLKAEELFRHQTCDVGGSSRKRFKRLVETTDWEGEGARLEQYANPACWGVIGLSVLYFLPVCLKALWG